MFQTAFDYYLQITDKQIPIRADIKTISFGRRRVGGHVFY